MAITVAGAAWRIVLGTLAACGGVHAATLQVAPTGADSGNCQAAACATIGYALSQAATSGDTVNIAAGTYVEQLTVDKNITLQGAGADSTIIKAPSSLVPLPAPNDNRNAIVFVTGGATITMNSLQVAGPGQAGAYAAIYFGVFVGDATLNFSNGSIKNIRDEPLSGMQSGNAIVFGRWPSTVGNGSITNSTISGFQKGAIIVSNTGSTVTVSGNTITSTTQTGIAQNGIQIYDGAVATVTGNTVTGLQYAPDPPNQWTASGILLWDAGAGTVLSSNSISNNDVGVAVVGELISEQITLQDNTISDSRVANVMAELSAILTMKDNTLSGSMHGLRVLDDGQVSLDGGNVLTGASVAAIEAGAGATVSGSKNQIAGNAAGVINEDLTASFSLNCNWWGAVSGPTATDNPGGSGDTVTAEVDYSNWAVDNTSFRCMNDPLPPKPTTTVTPVPVDAPWALLASAVALAGFGAGALRRRAKGRN